MIYLLFPHSTPARFIAAISLETKNSIGRDVIINANTNIATNDSVPREYIVIEVVPANPNIETKIIPNKYFLGRVMSPKLFSQFKNATL